MALPLPKVVADTEAGGLNALNAINEYANKSHLRKYNQVKSQYAPTTIQAEAASKLAYANLMAPQFIAKAMNNPEFMGNLTDEQANTLRDLVYGAGTRNNGMNAVNNLPIPTNQSLKSNSVWDKLKDTLGLNTNQPTNALSQSTQQLPNQPQPIPRNAVPHEPKVGDLVEGEGSNIPGYDEAFQKWQRTPEAQREFAKGESAVIPDTQWLLENFGPKKTKPIQMELNEAQSQEEKKSYAQKAGIYLGTKKEEEELGKFRAKAIDEIGHNQLQLSSTGSNIDKLIDDFTDPTFVQLRETIPFFQDTQLKIAAKTEDPAMRTFLGKIMGDIESFKQSTVNSFKGQTLKREFEFADKLKPSEDDTVYTALGKLQSLKALKEIAWEKNKLISKYIKKDKMDLADAVERADKNIDIKSIEKKVKDLTAPTIEVENSKGMKLLMTRARAKELGIKNV